MPDIRVRGVRDEVKAELVFRAARNGRSVQAEARRILEEAVLGSQDFPAQQAEASTRTSSSAHTLENEAAFAARADKRQKLFALLDSANARIDAASLPNPAELMSTLREEKDTDDTLLFASLLPEGGRA